MSRVVPSGQRVIGYDEGWGIGGGGGGVLAFALFGRGWVRGEVVLCEVICDGGGHSEWFGA